MFCWIDEFCFRFWSWKKTKFVTVHAFSNTRSVVSKNNPISLAIGTLGERGTVATTDVVNWFSIASFACPLHWLISHQVKGSAVEALIVLRNWSKFKVVGENIKKLCVQEVLLAFVVAVCRMFALTIIVIVDGDLLEPLGGGKCQPAVVFSSAFRRSLHSLMNFLVFGRHLLAQTTPCFALMAAQTITVSHTV